MHKWVFGLLALFCIVHIYRDYLQTRGRKNWFTEFGHFWDAPQYEIHGIIVAAVLATVFTALAIFS